MSYLLFHDINELSSYPLFLLVGADEEVMEPPGIGLCLQALCQVTCFDLLANILSPLRFPCIRSRKWGTPSCTAMTGRVEPHPARGKCTYNIFVVLLPCFGKATHEVVQTQLALIWAARAESLLSTGR